MKDAEGGTRTRTPRKQQRIFLPLQFSLPEVIQFVVWTMPSPYTIQLEFAHRREPSRLYTLRLQPTCNRFSSALPSA
ncbi:MAG: hypothetical protein HY774_13060 [Acidobacteria bacterium]|nr:hypothetical protein [Acidobacteriota bacterium]